MVILAPPWFALQTLLSVVEVEANKINMTLQRKLLCMVFKPANRRKLVCASCPEFTLAGCKLKFVDSFRYVGHIVDDCLCDDQDIKWEIKALFTRNHL